MAWQQQQQSKREAVAATQSKKSENGGVWSKAIMFLDGASYIIAFYLVDAFTFGPPQFRVVSPSVREEYAVGTSPGSPHRRFVSDSEIMSSAMHRHQFLAGEKRSSESERIDAGQHDTLCCADKNHQHRDDYFTNRSLHHYQKKLFSRQVERTLQVQPCIKNMLIIFFLSFLFLFYVQIFGVPIIVTYITARISSQFAPSFASGKASIYTLYHHLQDRLPLPRQKRTGYELLLSHLNIVWTRMIHYIHALLSR